MFHTRLKHDLYSVMAMLCLPTYEDVLQRSQIIIEKELARKETNVNVGKKPVNHNSNNKRECNEKSVSDKEPRQQGWVKIPTCISCEKKHMGEYSKMIGACFKCGKMGQMM